MIKILLTGSDGQLGQVLQQQFAGLTQFSLLACNRAVLDIADTIALKQLFNTYRPDIVLHCAAYTAVDQAELHSALCHSVNVTAVQQLAQLCRQHGCLLISLSSDYVFDGNNTRPYTEQDNTGALNQYGKSKQLAEQAAEQAQKYITLRTSWLFSDINHNFVTTIWRRAQRALPTTVVQDQFGGPTPARALAQAICQLAQQYALSGQLPYGLYHYSGYPYCSWYDFAHAIYQLAAPEHLNQLSAISSPFPGALARRPAYSCLDMGLFQQRFRLAAPDWRTELALYVNKLAK
ncbi:dTDP-4-dehydrorhamnose reductase [Rheinheimera gaetbuli]